MSNDSDSEHPLRQAVDRAEEGFRFATEWSGKLYRDDSVDADDPRYLRVLALEALAECAVDEARVALRDSDCPREWELREEGFAYDTVTAESAQEALREARDNVDRSNYSEAEGTLYIAIRVDCDETGESDSCTVTLDAEEPECSETAHDWQSPHDLLGGLKENPGVWGHGGGVIILEVCMHCGTERCTDTWAQNPETGEQGLRSVSYEQGKYAEELSGAAEADRSEYDV